MNNLKDYTNENDLYLFIAFHLSDDSEMQNNIIKLDRIMNDIFNEVQSKVTEAESTGTREVIYKIQKPIISSNNEHKQFYSNLKTIFTITEKFTPHFTQMQEN